jgi:uncharacterized protein with GYD domain
MPETQHTFVILMQLTERGSQDLDVALDAVDAATAVMTTAFHIDEVVKLVTLGGFDIVTVFRATDASVAAFYALELSRGGYVSTTTVCGYAPSEFRTWYAANKVTRDQSEA